MISLIAFSPLLCYNIVIKETEVTSVVKAIPSGEDGVGVLCKTRDGQLYRISQNTGKGIHTLWKVLEGSYEKIATGESPYDLYPRIPWDGELS